MAKPGRASQEKRNRERAQKERHQDKQERKAIRKAERAERDSTTPEGVDPDLVGIYPGPQPVVED
jgi:hypothetical protein